MKKGFVFLETIVVLSITMIVLLSLYGGYSTVMKSLEEKKYYDNINDIYKTNVIKNMLIKTPELGNKNYVNYNKDNCNLIMQEDCKSVMNSLNINDVYYTKNDLKALKNEKDLKPSLKKYIKKLEPNKNSLIIVINQDNHNYYSSLKVGEIK